VTTLASPNTLPQTALERPQALFWKQFLIAFVVAQAMGGIGAMSTDLGPWYKSLNKPWWQPPDWLFGPAWIAIFGLTAASAVYAWRNAPTKTSRESIVFLLLANGFFNILWSVLFFRFKRPDWSLLEAGALWASALIPIFVVSRYSKKAAWLLVPYISWVTFAGILNYKIVQLNPAQ
jgi:tryptophan-rich sensory protein